MNLLDEICASGTRRPERDAAELKVARLIGELKAATNARALLNRAGDMGLMPDLGTGDRVRLAAEVKWRFRALTRQTFPIAAARHLVRAR